MLASRRRTAPSRWKLARLGRTLVHLVNSMQDLSARGVSLRVLTARPVDMMDTSLRAVPTSPQAAEHRHGNQGPRNQAA